MIPTDFSEIILRIPAVIIAFAFHEWAHAMVADYFGDPTPRSQGRLSLNPFVHLDLFGTVLALFYRFGWAKPVQTRPSLYRGNKKRADICVSAAGPLINLLIGFIAIVISIVYLKYSIPDDAVLNILGEILQLNVIIGILNFIPIPGFDGYHILIDLLPDEVGAQISRIEPYGMIIFVLLVVSNVLGYVLTPLVDGCLTLFQTIATAILSIFGVG